MIQRYLAVTISPDDDGDGDIDPVAAIAAAALAPLAEAATAVRIRAGLTLDVPGPVWPRSGVAARNAGCRDHAVTGWSIAPKMSVPSCSIQMRTRSPTRRNGVIGPPRVIVSTIRCSAMHE